MATRLTNEEMYKRFMECGSDAREEAAVSTQAGIWNFDGVPAGEDLLRKLVRVMPTVSPDGEYVYNSGAVGMFYRAFHTTTESHLERQPYVSGRGNVITWDGRLDNREELERELKEEAFPDGSDVGVIAAAFDRWGTGCFRKFIGDWALAVWSPGEQTLVLARDYIGIRRLYYYATRKKIIWCTY